MNVGWVGPFPQGVGSIKFWVFWMYMQLLWYIHILGKSPCGSFFVPITRRKCKNFNTLWILLGHCFWIRTCWKHFCFQDLVQTVSSGVRAIAIYHKRNFLQIRPKQTDPSPAPPKKKERSIWGKPLLLGSSVKLEAFSLETSPLGMFPRNGGFDKATPENRGIQKMELQFCPWKITACQWVLAKRQCMSLTEKNWISFFSFPYFWVLPFNNIQRVKRPGHVDSGFI